MSHLLIPPALALAAAGLGLGLWRDASAPTPLPLPTLVLTDAPVPWLTASDASFGPDREESAGLGRQKAVRVVLNSPYQVR